MGREKKAEVATIHPSWLFFFYCLYTKYVLAQCMAVGKASRRRWCSQLLVFRMCRQMAAGSWSGSSKEQTSGARCAITICFSLPPNIYMSFSFRGQRPYVVPFCVFPRARHIINSLWYFWMNKWMKRRGFLEIHAVSVLLLWVTLGVVVMKCQAAIFPKRKLIWGTMS